MLSNLFELSGFGLIVTAIWWLAGMPAAFVAAGLVFLFIGLAIEGVHLSVRQRLSDGLAFVATLVLPRHGELDEPGEGAAGIGGDG